MSPSARGIFFRSPLLLKSIGRLTFTIRLSNMCVDTSCRHSMYSVCTSRPFVVPVVFLCVTFLGVLLSVCSATNVWKGVLLCDAIYLRVFIVVTLQWDEGMMMRGRRYIDSLDEANVAGLCKATGLATITLSHLAYIFFLLPFALCALPHPSPSGLTYTVLAYAA